MDPQIRSFLTTILAVALGSVATWLVKAGIITADQTSGFVEGTIGVILALAAAGVAWWKTRSHTPEAQVRVVAAMPSVARVEVKRDAIDGVATVAADSTQPKVVMEGIKT